MRCTGTMYNGPEKRFVRCNRCDRVDFERNEGDRCPSTGGTRMNPWDVSEVRAAHGGLAIHVTGFNHYTGEPLSWTLDGYSFTDPEFVARRMTYHRATWAPGAREAFKRVVAQRRRIRTQRTVDTSDYGYGALMAAHG